MVIPAFNEAERLPRTIKVAADYLATQPWRSRIVVVDNGSVDRTAAPPGRWPGPTCPSGHRLRSAGQGRGGAPRAVARRGGYVGFFDADLATPVETLGPVEEHLRAGAAAVIGSRYVAGAALVRRQPLRAGPEERCSGI